MAREPRHLGSEGEYRQCIQPAGPRTVHGQLVLGSPAGGSLYGLQHSNPVDTGVAYRGPATDFGTGSDPMVAHRIGGVNVFVADSPYTTAPTSWVAPSAVSGDSSCADHNIAWRTRHGLGLDRVPAGVSGDSTTPG